MNTLKSSLFAVTIAFSLMVLNFSLAETEPPKTDQPKVATADPNVQKSQDEKQDGQPEENTETTKPKTAVDDKIKPWDPNNGNPHEYMEQSPNGNRLILVSKVYDENGEYLGRLPFYRKDYDNINNVTSYYNDNNERLFYSQYSTPGEGKIFDTDGNLLHTIRSDASYSSQGKSNNGLSIPSKNGQWVQLDSKDNIMDAYIAPASTSQFTKKNAYTVGFPALERWIIYDKNWKYITDVPFAEKK